MLKERFCSAFEGCTVDFDELIIQRHMERDGFGFSFYTPAEMCQFMELCCHHSVVPGELVSLEVLMALHAGDHSAAVDAATAGEWWTLPSRRERRAARRRLRGSEAGGRPPVTPKGTRH